MSNQNRLLRKATFPDRLLIMDRVALLGAAMIVASKICQVIATNPAAPSVGKGMAGHA